MGSGPGSGSGSGSGSGGDQDAQPAWDGAPISSAISLDASYAVQVAYESDVRVNGVAAGDLDPTVPGDEIVAVDHLGRVHVIARVRGKFRHDLIATTGGELVQVAVGDLLPSVPGDEIVAVGVSKGTEDDPGAGIIRVFHRDGSGGWRETSYLTPGLVHGVAVGTVGLLPADSFVCAGFFRQVLVGNLTMKVKGGGIAMGIGAIDLPRVGNVKGVALTEEGFVLATDDGHSIEYTAALGEILPRRPVQHGSPLARVGYAKEIGMLFADNDGYLRVTSPVLAEGDSPTESILERAKQRLRGAIFVDIDPNNPGLEACSAGYDGRVRVVGLNRVEQKQLDLPGQPVTIGWKGEVRYVARDSGKLHHLAKGEIDGIGTCLISCGYSGDVLLIHRQDG
ncbi:MAG: hypothetical protein ACI80K_003535 [Paracoccaceae bacterium]